MSDTEHATADASLLVALHNTIWNTSTQDFGGYSSRDALAVAHAILDSGWLEKHDAELTERVRAEQRETDARIGHDAAAEWVDGWQPNSHKNSRIEDCIAAAIREAGKQ